MHNDNMPIMAFIMTVLLICILCLSVKLGTVSDRVKELEAQSITLQQVSEQLSVTQHTLREAMRKHNY